MNASMVSIRTLDELLPDWPAAAVTLSFVWIELVLGEDAVAVNLWNVAPVIPGSDPELYCVWQAVGRGYAEDALKFAREHRSPRIITLTLDAIATRPSDPIARAFVERIAESAYRAALN
jgi:hypothetical protein